MAETNTLKACPVRALRNSKSPVGASLAAAGDGLLRRGGEEVRCQRVECRSYTPWLDDSRLAARDDPPQPSFPPCTVAGRMPYLGRGEAEELLQVDGQSPSSNRCPRAGCRRYSGHPCHGPEKKSKGAQRSGSDMRRMFHRCIASGDDTRRSAGQGAAGSQWPPQSPSRG